eukprot:4269841-Pleurochrysis_carterae.AAC.5
MAPATAAPAAAASRPNAAQARAAAAAVQRPAAPLPGLGQLEQPSTHTVQQRIVPENTLSPKNSVPTCVDPIAHLCENAVHGWPSQNLADKSMSSAKVPFVVQQGAVRREHTDSAASARGGR